ncbi:MAG: putative decarboxylase [Frankiales bacterium]|nr:putative decarboxylase [Frankiales bacterium]
MGGAVVDLLSRFVDERYDARTSDYADLEPLLASLAGPPPAAPGDLGQLLSTVEHAASKGFDTANPGFVGYIPGGGLYSAALGDFIACVVNRYTGVAAPAPALVQLESSVLRWLCDAFGMPVGSQGVLTPGGSMSTLSAVVAARSTRLGEDFRGARLYVSDEVHHCVAKSAQIAGLPRDAVRVVRTDDHLRLDPAALREAIVEDRAAGLVPFMAVASAGTINTGVVDPLTAVADVCAEQDVWFHVDGAYGGFFQLTERGRVALAGIERADSIVLDPHKGLFLPYGTGCLLVRDREALRAAHEVQAHYLPPPSDDPGLPDFSAFSPELTRDFRGLRLWLPLHLHGTQAFVDALDEKLDLARELHGALSGLDLELAGGPDLSLVAFRPLSADPDALLDRINGTGRMWLSSAPVRGRTFLRMCLLSHRTRRDRVEEAVQIIRQSLEP